MASGVWGVLGWTFVAVGSRLDPERFDCLYLYSISNNVEIQNVEIKKKKQERLANYCGHLFQR